MELSSTPSEKMEQAVIPFYHQEKVKTRDLPSRLGLIWSLESMGGESENRKVSWALLAGRRLGKVRTKGKSIGPSSSDTLV